jgi:quinol-cytochrome oxidoreductase complex cytochrome b subunit
VLLPGIGFSMLLLAPFLDSSKERSLKKRPVAAFVGFCLLASVIILTVLSLL